METTLLIQILVGLAIMNTITTIAVLPGVNKVDSKLSKTLETIKLVQQSQADTTRNFMELIKELIFVLSKQRGRTP